MHKYINPPAFSRLFLYETGLAGRAGFLLGGGGRGLPGVSFDTLGLATGFSFSFSISVLCVAESLSSWPPFDNRTCLSFTLGAALSEGEEASLLVLGEFLFTGWVSVLAALLVSSLPL